MRLDQGIVKYNDNPIEIFIPEKTKTFLTMDDIDEDSFNPYITSNSMFGLTILLSDIEDIYTRKVYSILDLAGELGGLLVALVNVLGPVMKFYT
jgi:hypothetical protein